MSPVTDEVLATEKGFWTERTIPSTSRRIATGLRIVPRSSTSLARTGTLAKRPEVDFAALDSDPVYARIEVERMFAIDVTAGEPALPATPA